jgi:hypothetical protein
MHQSRHNPLKTRRLPAAEFKPQSRSAVILAACSRLLRGRKHSIPKPRHSTRIDRAHRPRFRIGNRQPGIRFFLKLLACRSRPWQRQKRLWTDSARHSILRIVVAVQGRSLGREDWADSLPAQKRGKDFPLRAQDIAQWHTNPTSNMAKMGQLSRIGMAAGLHRTVQAANSSTSRRKEGNTVKLQHLLRNSALVAVFGAFALAAASPAHANTIWTDWTSATPGNPGSASGTMGGIAVTYSGQLGNWNYNNNLGWVGGLASDPWDNSGTLPSTYVGGVVGNAPTQDAVEMTGPEPYYDSGTVVSETITFSSPVTNPVMAIWSLGHVGDPAEFIFTGLSNPLILEAGGPDGYPDGQSIEACTDATLAICSATMGTSGTVAYGVEGSGTVLFPGTYSSISFTTPAQEWSYGFTPGYVTPEPETLSLLGLGLLALPLLRASLARRRRA